MFDDPAILARLGAVKSAGFETKLVILDPGGHHIVGDMRRILPVMRERRLGQLGG